MKKKAIGFITVMILFVVSIATFMMAGAKNTKAVYASDLFIAQDGVIFKNNAQIPVETGDIVDRRYGLGLTIPSSATIALKSDMCGIFEIDYRIYSNVTGINDLDNMTFVFTDQISGKAFSVFIQMRANEWYEPGGFGFTYATFPDSTVRYGTYEGTVLQTTGQWTTSSFCNIKEPQQAVMHSTKLKFDPNEKCIYVWSASAWSKLIDLDDPASCAIANQPKVTGFDRYKVEMLLGGAKTSVNENNPINMLIYSLNGQRLCGETLSNTIGASVAMPMEYALVSGGDYKLPKPIMYDVLDGISAYNGVVSVKKGTSPEDISDGIIHDVTFSKYTISLSAGTDSDGRVGEPWDATITSMARHPGHTITLSETLEDCSIGKNTKIKLPSATSKSNVVKLEDKTIPTKLTISSGQTILKTIENACEETEFFFSTSGIYTVKYESIDYVGDKQSLIFTITVDEKIPTMNLSEISKLYSVGSNFIMPTIESSLNGVTIASTVKLIKPDKTIVTGQNVILDRVGQYSVVASCVSGGVTYNLERKFSVKTPTASLIENVKGSIIESDVLSPSYAESKRGVKVTATKANASVRYNKPIDVASLSSSGAPLIEFMITPPNVGEFELNSILFTLTDSIDKRNYIEIFVQRVTDEGYFTISTVQAGSKGNGRAGYEWGRLTDVVGKGTNLTTSFYGLHASDKAKMTTGRLFYDNATRTVYTGYDNDKLKVLDLDDKLDTGAGKEWQGFMSDKAYLSVTASGIAASKASYMIFAINGQSLSGEYVTSDTPPKIDVDMKGNKTAPKAKAGAPYPIFDATAYDQVNGLLALDTEVYKNYNTATQEVVPFADGAFIPSEGEYTILYSCGKTVAQVRVDCDSDIITPPTFSFDSAIPKGFVGDKVVLPAFTTGGGTGKITTEFAAKYDGTNEKVEIKNNVISPKKEGTIVITAKVCDYIGQTTTVNTSISIKKGRIPVLVNDLSMPKVIIDNATFIFPKLNALDYSGASPVAAQTDITVIRANGNEEKLVDRKFLPKITTESEAIKVRYRAYASGSTTEYLEKIYPVMVKKLALNDENHKVYKESYFLRDKEVIKSKMDNDGITFSTSENSSMSFVNALYSGDFNIQFSIPKGNLSRVVFTLTDSENAEIEVKLGVVNVSGVSYLEINGVRCGKLSGIFGTDNSFNMTITDSNEITNAARTPCGKIETVVSGEAFTGFSSSKIYLDIAFEGVTSESQFRIVILDGQYMDDTIYDEMRPTIVTSDVIPRKVEIGEEITAPSAYAIDVLDPYTELTVSVTAPKGIQIYKNVDASKDLKFIAEKYGQYEIVYKAFDGADNMNNMSFAVTVIDRIPPTLSYGGKIPTLIRVNEEITLPVVTVSDNNDEKLKLYVHYIDPLGTMVAIENGKFTPTMTGTYTLTFFAKDKSYSYVREEFTIVVGR